MQVRALDHINIVTNDLDRTAQFYSELLGLEPKNAPPPLTPENARWLFDEENRAVIHLNLLGKTRSVPRDTPAGPQTGAIHHIAFDCRDIEIVLERIGDMDLDYTTNYVDAIRLAQLFVQDDNGVLLELNFRDVDGVPTV